MKIAYRILQDYVKTTTPPEKLAERFRMTSSEVEEVVSWEDRLRGLVVGKVLSVQKHPKADRLNLAVVSLGREKKHIVCGDPNLAAGQIIILATPGTTLHPLKGDPLTIEETEIRGERSQGMICTASEIGLPYQNPGTILLDEEEVTLGMPAAKALFLDDTVLDLEITPNRPDLLSYRGLAREVCAFEKRTLLEPGIYTLEEKYPQGEAPVSVTVEDFRICSRYTGICLDNIKVGESPLWLQGRLILSGMRPVNNIVDITNYVMLELGQPMHTFDLDILQAHGPAALTVRSAAGSESLTTLDGSVIKLKEGDIIITDSKNRATDLAGIMGGKESEVTSATSRIFLESATFNGPQIRRTSRAHGVRTEASGRFEKGLDPELTVTALKRTVHLLQELAGAQVCGNLIDIGPKTRPERPRIHVSFARIQQVLGVNISAAETKSIMQHLGFQIPSLTKSSFEVVAPSWRKDVSMPEDIMEELIRIWGYERLPSTFPSGQIKPPTLNQHYDDKRKIRRLLAGAGMHEAIHVPFASASNIERFGYPADTCVKLAYPLSAETEYLVPDHVVHLMGNLSGPNLRETEVGMFEIGKVFRAPTEENERLSLVFRSSNQPELLFRQVKSILGMLGTALKLPAITTTASDTLSEASFFETGSSLEIRAGETGVGHMGLISKDIVSGMKIRSGRTILYATLSLSSLLTLPKQRRAYAPGSPFPSIERDMSLIVAESTESQGIIDIIAAHQDQALLESWHIATVFTGKPLPVGTKSVTLHFTYNAGTRTLEDAEVQADQKNLATALRSTLAAEITE